MLIVSNYHYIRENFSAEFPSIFGVTPKQFKAQLEELGKAGTFISQEELLQFKNREFDKNYILITFDDGLKEQSELAKPILDEMGIPFIFFINTSNFLERNVSLVHKIHLVRSHLSSEDILDELKKNSSLNLNTEEKALAIAHYNYDKDQTAHLKYLLNFKLSVKKQQELIDPLFNYLFDEGKVASELYFDDNMLQELSREGYLGSHSHNHLPLGNLSQKELEQELSHTQQFFQEKFGRPAASISYPYGSFEACTGISELIESHDFKLGFTMERAKNLSLKEDSLLLSRFDCNDMPLGKNELFAAENLFQNNLLRNWYKNENSPSHKRKP
ncbi:polysaccharide deacetylase family protein [Antarcticibacterium sp. 1MA-6-2]|uniref:polysaccharide deacetylase family protein n=1 Tax=Antarcticibacterium sp. 1MA-6-2 TaxID=2908210 RepID=UPI001F1FDDE5|nr:polysaccharide deacetylase family protein [Antarcticibacterium sp. 1MA-6-2]UJH92537.1 polysaccharide deacetylase family protein [Antarcticibacterium sp. 1MA-6-2]